MPLASMKHRESVPGPWIAKFKRREQKAVYSNQSVDFKLGEIVNDCKKKGYQSK